MDGRFSGKTIDTIAQLVEEIDYVLAQPEIAGFDCMLAREVLADQASKYHAMAYGLHGIKVHMQGSEEHSTPTHLAARVIVTPPIKIKA